MLIHVLFTRINGMKDAQQLDTILVIFGLFHFFSICDRKRQKNIEKGPKKLFWLANGMRRTRLLVKIHNMIRLERTITNTKKSSEFEEKLKKNHEF